MLAGAALLVAAATHAGDWEVQDFSTLSLTGIDRTGNNEQTGTVLQATPRVVIKGSGGRTSADINIAPTFSVGTDDVDPRDVTLNMLARGRVEVVENFFSLGANAGSRLVGNSNSVGTVDAINVNSDGSQVFSAAVLPQFQALLGRNLQMFSNNVFDAVWYSRKDENNPRRNNDDSVSGLLNLGIGSRPNAAAVGWSVAGTYKKTDFKSREDETLRDVVGTATYQLNSTWALLADLGYEDNDVNTRRSKTKGTIWGAGFRWTPNPRHAASFRFQDRYFGDAIEGSYSLRSRRSRFELAADRGIDNRRNDQLIESSFFLTDENGNQVINPEDGSPVVVTETQTLLQDEDYLNTRVRALWAVEGIRTKFTLRGSVANRDYEISDRDEDIVNVGATVTRVLGSRWSATLGGRYEARKRQQVNQDSDFYNVTFALTRALGRRTSASLSLTHRERDSDIDLDDYKEDRIGIALTTSFL